MTKSISSEDLKLPSLNNAPRTNRSNSADLPPRPPQSRSPSASPPRKCRPSSSPSASPPRVRFEQEAGVSDLLPLVPSRPGHHALPPLSQISVSDNSIQPNQMDSNQLDECKDEEKPRGSEQKYGRATSRSPPPGRVIDKENDQMSVSQALNVPESLGEDREATSKPPRRRSLSMSKLPLIGILKHSDKQEPSDGAKQKQDCKVTFITRSDSEAEPTASSRAKFEPVQESSPPRIWQAAASAARSAASSKDPWHVILYGKPHGHEPHRIAVHPLVGIVLADPTKSGMILPRALTIEQNEHRYMGPMLAALDQRKPAFKLVVHADDKPVMAKWHLRKELFVIPWRAESLDLVLHPTKDGESLQVYVTPAGEVVRFAQKLAQDEVTRLLQLRKLPLVLDLDQTLIDAVLESEQPKRDAHFTVKGKNCRVRPFVPQFLLEVQQWYDLYVCTAGAMGHARPILQELVQYLHRNRRHANWNEVVPVERIVSVWESCVAGNPEPKDLRLMYASCFSKYGLRLVSVVDDQVSFWVQVQQPNVFHIRPFLGESSGVLLPAVLSMLEQIHKDFFEAVDANPALSANLSVADFGRLPDVRAIRKNLEERYAPDLGSAVWRI